MTRDMDEFLNRLNRHLDELRWLYMELYDNGSMFAELCSQMEAFYKERGTELKKRDREKLETPEWFQKQDMLGMMLYIDNFAGDLKGVKKKLSYLQKCGVTCLHLMRRRDVQTAAMQFLISERFVRIWELWRIWRLFPGPVIRRGSISVWIL